MAVKIKQTLVGGCMVVAYLFSCLQIYSTFNSSKDSTSNGKLCKKGSREVKCAWEIPMAATSSRFERYRDNKAALTKLLNQGKDGSSSFNNHHLGLPPKKTMTKRQKKNLLLHPSGGDVKVQRHKCTYDGQQLIYPQHPTFVIVGAQKTGTTSLLSYFGKHPLIAKPALDEPHVFDGKIYGWLRQAQERRAERTSKEHLNEETRCLIGHEYYKTLAGADDDGAQLVRPLPFSFEKTPSYLHRFSAPGLLKQACPWIPKVIIILRNPVDRAYSQYRMAAEHNNFTQTFEESIREEIQTMRDWRMTIAPHLPDEGNDTIVTVPWDHPVDKKFWTQNPNKAFNRHDDTDATSYALMLRKGIYAPQIKHWLNHYPREAILILDYHQLQQNTTDVYFRILDFAGIPRDIPSHAFKKRRTSNSSDYVPMADATRAYLEDFYAPYNAQIKDILGEEYKRGPWTFHAAPRVTVGNLCGVGLKKPSKCPWEVHHVGEGGPTEKKNKIKQPQKEAEKGVRTKTNNQEAVKPKTFPNTQDVPTYECLSYNGTKLSYPQYPTFIIAGAQKTGTTSLLTYFGDHPLIAEPARFEPHFFDKRFFSLIQESRNIYPDDKTIRNETWCHVGHEYYKILTANASPNVLLPYSFEKTPSYLHQFSAPITIKQTCPWIPKVVIILRNPTDRAYSQYQMMRYRSDNITTGGIGQTFEIAIRQEVAKMQSLNMTRAPKLPKAGDPPVDVPWDHAIDEEYWTEPPRKVFHLEHTVYYSLMLRKGIYAPQIRQWLKHYPREAILILTSDELKRNTSDVYFRILDFVGIPRDQPLHEFRQTHQKTYKPMANATREYLDAFFAPYNAQLEGMLGSKWKGVWTSNE